MSSGIYKITFGGTKCYVGSSIDINRRKLEHLNRLSKGTSNCVILQKAYLKYGKDKFNLEVLEYCSFADLKNREMYWILKLKSTKKEFGYNAALDTSIPMLGRKHTEKTKQLMSRKAMGNTSHLGRKLTDKHKRNLSNSLKGKGLGISVNIGENNAGCKLTKKEALEIFQLKGKLSQRKIAIQFKISQQTVSKIHRKIKWKSIHKN